MATTNAAEKACTAVIQDLNAALLDARLCEIIQNLRALVRSNRDLRDALVDSPNDEDFLLAVAENDAVIARKREEAAELVRKLRQEFNVDADLPADIWDMDLAKRGSTDAAAQVATELPRRSAEQQPLAPVEEARSGEGGGGGEDGFYL